MRTCFDFYQKSLKSKLKSDRMSMLCRAGIFSTLKSDYLDFKISIGIYLYGYIYISKILLAHVPCLHVDLV